VRNGVLSTIGNTPLIRLTHILEGSPLRLFAKLEGFNPGGSSKDRSAMMIVEQAWERRQLRSGSTVVESSSGNMGIGLAQACAYLGLRFICVVDKKTTSQNIEILKAYGAEVDVVTSPDPSTGEFLQSRIKRVQDLVRTIPNSFWPDQYSNLDNPLAHHETMREIDIELAGDIDYLFCATSTCGTMRGCAEYIREQNMKTTLIAVDAEGSQIFGSAPKKRLIPGHGAAVVPNLFQENLADMYIHVSDVDCIVGCRRLVQQEAILAGGSSGAVLMAFDQFKDNIRGSKTCVVILPDRGERYLDTIYSDVWVQQNFGEISHLWEREVEV
jgi:2,3-diaminopropionate biosynthesis protein SbnA